MSKYIESVLAAGEKTRYQAEASIWSVLPLFVAGLITLPIFGVGLIFWIVAAIKFRNTDLAITDKRIIGRYGIFKKETIDILLTKAKIVDIDQSAIGKYLNYGSVRVSGAGATLGPVPGIDNPAEFRRGFLAGRTEEHKAPLKAAA